VNLWNPAAVRSFLVPGAILLAGTALLVHSGLLPTPPSAVNFYYGAAFGAGLLLAWRFHSSRVFFTLVVLLLAERALGFFYPLPHTSGAVFRTAFEALSVLLPLNFIAVSFLRERGFAVEALGSRLLLVFLQSTFVAVLCRPEQTVGLFHVTIVKATWLSGIKVPQLGLLAFLIALAVMAGRFVIYRKPVESGFFWALIGAFLAFEFGGIGRIPTIYLATSGLILVFSIVETSYLMAYHDELTGLPARRAFNGMLPGLTDPYAIAIVDVDHFKNFNDTYGHETGDQVLRMVAFRLAAVSGGGKAFRCGGEEFSVVFPGKSMSDVLPHLELLRKNIEASSFRVRAPLDRRRAPRGTDRRQVPDKRTKRVRRPVALPTAGEDVFVTVSIGVAEPGTRNRDIDQVIRAADRALYRAKHAGRNRVETDSPTGRIPGRHPARSPQKAQTTWLQ
jgi:diguanylate cyclase (GGDEF)-like protein